MPETRPRPGSLVLYKHRPALVRQADDKLEIELEGDKVLKVRPKDVTVLHPGPMESLEELRPQAGEVKAAWELLTGTTTSLAELAELIYENYTPATAWAAWQLVADGLYFRGSPEEVAARSPEDVALEKEARQAKAAEKQAWVAFLERAGAGQIIPEDSRYLNEVEELARRQRSKSRVLHELGHAEGPENAHALLLALGHWDHTINPYPQRLGLPISLPAMELPDLPEEERADLTHLPAFAIDDEGNRDPDDALSWDGNRLWVHIADVAALVHPESQTDLEARARGANLYLPEGTVPMLPPKATQLLGLGLGEVSPALSFGLDLDPQGAIQGVEVVTSWVRVERLTYEEAEDQITAEPFEVLYRLAQTYEARRAEKGAILIDLPEVKIWVEGDQVQIRPLPPLRSRTMVREMMLMTGEAVAEFALERGIPLPFTTQEPSEAYKPPEGLAEMFALRRTLRPRQYKSIPGPHAGLGLTIYVQATSPLRRYLDLTVHQQLRAHLRGQGLLEEQDVLARVGAAEAVTRSVRQVEQLARRHWTLVYLLQHPNWRGEGILVEKYGTQGKLIIPELALEVSVHLRDNVPMDSKVPLALNSVNLPALEAFFQVEN